GTTEAAGEQVLRSGFRDHTARYLTEREWTGVWVSDRPLDNTEGASGMDWAAATQKKPIPIATYREAKLTLLITQITKTETSPALANTPDTTAALNKITPSAY